MRNILIVTLIASALCSAGVNDPKKDSCNAASRQKQEQGNKKPQRPKPLYRQIFMI